MLGFLNRFIDSNDRELKRIQPIVDRTNQLEPEFKALSDADIRARIDDIRAEILVERGSQLRGERTGGGDLIIDMPEPLVRPSRPERPTDRR